MNKVFIIILNYNGEQDTIDCIDSILKTTYYNKTICIVDNGSKKQSTHILSEYLKDINKVCELIYILNNENLGFAGGNNVAIKIAIEQNYEYVLLLNNDTIVEPDFLENLMHFSFLNTQYIALTPRICYENNKDIIWNCGGKLTWFKNRRYYFRNKNISIAPQIGHKEISFITGCCLLFKPQITGLLTDNFFFGEEDFEFSLRMKIQKRKMACVFNSVIYHKVGCSIKNIKSCHMGKMKLFYINRFVNIKNHCPKTWFIWFIINSTYAFFLLFKEYKLNIYKNIIF